MSTSLGPKLSYFMAALAVASFASCTVPNPNVQSSSTSQGGDAGTRGSSGRATDVGPSMTSSGTDSEAAGTATTSGGELTGATTEAVETCAEGNSCLSAPPKDWQGPGIVALTERGNAPECPADHPDAVLTVRSDLSAVPATCDCDCAAATGVSCGSPQMTHVNSGLCTAAGGITLSSPCTTINPLYGPSGRYRAADPGLAGGSCAAIPTQNIEAAQFQTEITVCGGAMAVGSCDERSESCLPDSSGLFERKCIWQQGDQACPASNDYDVRFVYFSAVDDSRACTPCTCGTPQGSCEGEITLRTSSNCSGGLSGGMFPSDASCFTALRGGLSIAGVQWGPPANNMLEGTCTPSSSSPTGEAQPADPVTFCCTGA